MKAKEMPPLTAAEAMRVDEVVAEIHTSPSDVGGASSISTLREPESCLLPSLERPKRVRALGDGACRRQPHLNSELFEPQFDLCLVFS